MALDNQLTHPQIAVIDYGSQVTHLLARAIRQLNVYSEIVDPTIDLNKLKSYKGIILSGGPSSVYDSGSPQIDKEIFNLGIPILGICYGHQLMSSILGGKVEPGTVKEYGKANLTITSSRGILADFKEGGTTQIWMSHGDTVSMLPPGFEVLATTPDCNTAVIGNLDKRFFGIQFHPEVKHSVEGMKMLDSFLRICGCERDWQLPDYLEHKLATISAQAEGKNVFLLISGGVDSTVAFALLSKALGADRVHGLLVDTGFMRANEVMQVQAALKQISVKHLTVYDAKELYLSALKNVADPETKRQIIGQAFLDVKDTVSQNLNLDDDNWLLGQGTIYPDTIESGGTKHADKIKTHHNRIDHIQELINQGQVIEPLVDLYKDEVRTIGKLLGLPQELVMRHPFPGPGLAVRILCQDQPDLVLANHKNEIEAIERQVKAQNANFESYVLPVKSVGVQGDGRTYRHPLAIEANGLSGKQIQELLDLSTDLVNSHRLINRVVLKVSPNPITQITSLSAKYLTSERTALLQAADAIFTSLLVKYNLYDAIWQSPVILLPIATDATNNESLVLRPVASLEAMTADAFVLPTELIEEYCHAIIEQKLPISGVFYDLTHKPPGTIEWE